ncbi:conserved hypothetical protein [Ricinus communis]|uniref:5'-nucleotidase n=1 Tax=Ricinus communis TaxID=3988 RepID=B9T9E4_RICCO|nr:conserved hypothetical protein [Ricinus communis]
MIDDEEDAALRIAFDFDGVLVDDESETVFQARKDVNEFKAHEAMNVMQPHNPGPLQQLLVRVSAIQSAEEEKKKLDPSYKNRLRVSIVTARDAPAHERAMNTLKSWGVMANDAFFLGGIEKSKVLAVLRPHIFFDDQSGHLQTTSEVVPSEYRIGTKQYKADQAQLRQGQAEKCPVDCGTIACATEHQRQGFFEREVFKHVIKADTAVSDNFIFMRLQPPVTNSDTSPTECGQHLKQRKSSMQP